MTPTPPSPEGYHLAQILEEVADWTLDIDASTDVRGEDIRYTDQDAMNALQIFFHVCNNIAIQGYRDKGLLLDDTLEAHQKKGEHLAAIFKELTGIDSRTFYKK